MTETGSAHSAAATPAARIDVGFEERGKPRRLVLRLIAFWVIAAIAVATLPWIMPVTYSFLLYPSPFIENQLFYLAGSLAWIMIVTVPIAIAVGIPLGLASAACARVTRPWAPGARRWRWAGYLGSLLAGYVAVIAIVAILAPTAVQSVTDYAVCAALIAVGSCFTCDGWSAGIAWPRAADSAHDRRNEGPWVIGIAHPRGDYGLCAADSSFEDAWLTADLPSSSTGISFKPDATKADVQRVLTCLEDSLTAGRSRSRKPTLWVAP